MAETIAQGRMTVRQMTREERIVSDRRRATIQAARVANHARNINRPWSRFGALGPCTRRQKHSP
jgi:hypothetical protein